MVFSIRTRRLDGLVDYYQENRWTVRRDGVPQPRGDVLHRDHGNPCSRRVSGEGSSSCCTPITAIPSTSALVKAKSNSIQECGILPEGILPEELLPAALRSPQFPPYTPRVSGVGFRAPGLRVPGPRNQRALPYVGRPTPSERFRVSGSRWSLGFEFRDALSLF